MKKLIKWLSITILLIFLTLIFIFNKYDNPILLNNSPKVTTICHDKIDKKNAYGDNYDPEFETPIDNPVYIIKNDNIMLGIVSFTTPSTIHDHLVGCSYELRFIFQQDLEDEYLYNITNIQIPHSLQIAQQGSSLLPNVNYLYDANFNYAYTKPDNIVLRADNINNVRVSITLEQLDLKIFYNNLKLIFFMDVTYNYSEHIYINFEQYYSYSFSYSIEYTTWDMVQSAHTYDCQLRLFSDFFAAGQHAGYDQGYNVGYETGYTDGAENTPTFEWLESLFGAVDRLLSIEIFPGFKIWYIFGVGLMVSLIVAVMKLMR